MKHNLYSLFILLFIFGTFSVDTYAQSQNITQIRAYISRANVALTNKKWNSALESVNEAQKLAGQNGAVFESIRVRAYFGKKEYARAKQSMETFYNLSPSQSAINEIVAYETMIEDEIQEEKNRLARLEQQEKNRIEREKKRQAEQEAYQKKLDAISVHDEAIIIGNKMRKDIHRSILGGGTVSDISYSFNTVVSHNFFGEPQYDDVSIYDRIQVSDPESIYRTDFDDGSITLRYTIKGIRNCDRGDRWNMTRSYSVIYFSTTSSQLKVQFKLDVDINKNAFGCLNLTREYRAEFTQEVKGFIERHLRANLRSLNNIRLSENQKLALKKDKPAFMQQFIRTVASRYERKTNKELQKEREYAQQQEATRKAKEQKRLQNEATLINLKKALDNALENDDYKTALNKLIAYRDLKKEMGKDTQAEDQSIVEYQEKILENEKVLKRATELIVDDNTRLDREEYYLKKALKLQPSNTSFKNKLLQIEQRQLERKVDNILSDGDELLKENNISKAITTYKTALKIFPNDEETLNKINTAEDKLESKADGKGKLLADIKKELENNDSYDVALTQNAKKRVLDFLKDYPNDIDLLVTATDLFIQEKLGLEEAQNLAEKVFKLEPKNVANLSNLGEIHYQSNRIDKSMQFFQDAWDSGNTDDPNILKRLSQGNYTLYLRTKDNVYAENTLKFARRAQELGLDDSIYSRVINKFCTETTPCNE